MVWHAINCAAFFSTASGDPVYWRSRTGTDCLGDAIKETQQSHFAGCKCRTFSFCPNYVSYLCVHHNIVVMSSLTGWARWLPPLPRVLQHQCSEECSGHCSQLLSEHYPRWVPICGWFPATVDSETCTSGTVSENTNYKIQPSHCLSIG